MVEEIVEFADERLESGNIRLVTKLLTNGVLSESVAKRLVPLFNGVQISWDGFLENHPRYGSENAKVAKAVWKSIKTFSEASSTVNIAIVASEHNAHLLGKIIDEIYDSFQIEHIFIALKDTLGKASGEKGLDYGALRKEYVRAWKKYRAIGIDIPLTGTDVHSISQYPCGLSAPNLSIAPDGSISSCTVSFNDSDAFAKRFDIGRVSPIGLVLDGKRIEAFQSLDVASLPECSDCFSKWHCRGGCTYANRNAPMPEIAPERCDFIRKVVADKILHLA